MLTGLQPRLTGFILLCDMDISFSLFLFIRYKEEVLKRVLKEYASNVQDHVRDWIRARQENTSSDSKSASGKKDPTSIASTSSASSSHSSLPPDSKYFKSNLCKNTKIRL